MARRYNKITLLLIILLLSSVFSGCSVIAAANGSEDPNLEIVKPGAERRVVEIELGEPVESKKIPNGERALYTFKVGDEPAIGRAFLYLLGDIVTLFYAEYLFTPLEASNSGNAKDLIVEYDSTNRVRVVEDVQSKSPEELL